MAEDDQIPAPDQLKEIEKMTGELYDFIGSITTFLYLSWVVVVYVRGIIKTTRSKRKGDREDIKEGYSPRPYSSYLDKGFSFLKSSTWSEFIICSFLLIGGGGLTSVIVWPALLLFLVIQGCCKVAAWYNAPEKVVLRALKKNPDILDLILENESHKYYDIANKLKSAGTIVLNGKTVEIDGRIYDIKLRK